MQRNTNSNSIFRNRIYQIFGIAILCIVLVMTVFNVTLGWFKDESITSSGDPNIILIGTISLDVTTNFNFYNLALAPDTIYTLDKDNADIGTYVKTSAEHDIDGAFVRIRFVCTNRPEVTLYFDSSNITTVSTYNESIRNRWYYSETDEYYYYLGNVETTNVQFNAGYRVDNTLNNSVAGQVVSFNFTIEAIQRQYGAYHDWSTAPTVFNQFAYTETGR